MTVRKKIIVTGAGLLIVVLLVGIYFSMHAGKRAATPAPVAGEIQVVPLHLQNGWGYKILVNQKTYIYQDVIPAIPGYHPFRSERDAMVTGKLVAEKLKNGKPPFLSREELESLSVLP